MKKTYTQLFSEERDKIAILRAQGLSLEKIAHAIGRNKSPISRELKRNKSPIYNVYLPPIRQICGPKNENIKPAKQRDLNTL